MPPKPSGDPVPLGIVVRILLMRLDRPRLNQRLTTWLAAWIAFAAEAIPATLRRDPRLRPTPSVHTGPPAAIAGTSPSLPSCPRWIMRRIASMTRWPRRKLPCPAFATSEVVNTCSSGMSMAGTESLPGVPHTGTGPPVAAWKAEANSAICAAVTDGLVHAGGGGPDIGDQL